MGYCIAAHSNLVCRQPEILQRSSDVTSVSGYKCSNCVLIGYHIASHTNLAVYIGTQVHIRSRMLQVALHNKL